MHEKDKVSYTEWLAYSEAMVWVTYVEGVGVWLIAMMCHFLNHLNK